MIDDLALIDLAYAAVGIGCLVGLLILRTRPPVPPVSRWALRRVNERIEATREGGGDE